MRHVRPKVCARSIAFWTMWTLSCSVGAMLMAASVMISACSSAGTSITKQWLMRRLVRSPVSRLTTAPINSSVWRLPFISASTLPSRTRRTAASADASLCGASTIEQPVEIQPASAATRSDSLPRGRPGSGRSDLPVPPRSLRAASSRRRGAPRRTPPARAPCTARSGADTSRACVPCGCDQHSVTDTASPASLVSLYAFISSRSSPSPRPSHRTRVSRSKRSRCIRTCHRLGAIDSRLPQANHESHRVVVGHRAEMSWAALRHFAGGASLRNDVTCDSARRSANELASRQRQPRHGMCVSTAHRAEYDRAHRALPSSSNSRRRRHGRADSVDGGALALVSSDGAGFVQISAQSRAETYTATASVKTAGGASLTAPVAIDVTDGPLRPIGSGSPAS